VSKEFALKIIYSYLLHPFSLKFKTKTTIMNKLMLIAAATCFIMSCNNEGTKSSGDEKMDTTAAAASTTVDYPYKADYTIDFKMGDANNSKLVLDFFKLWETGNIDAMRPMMTDSVWIDFSDGSKVHATADSVIKMAKQFRSTMSKIETKIDTWMPVHANDKNEDWVLVWARDYVTDNKGKLDSSRTHSYWQVKGSKIAGWSEFNQKLTEPMPAKK
jgi:ketosteroid isomerase-like protein